MLRVAAVYTEFTRRSHAHVILENFLEPYVFNGRRTEPGMKIASFYADQARDRDLGRRVAEQYDVPIFPTVEQALCPDGNGLGVDAVLLIGEHGRYPVNAKGQRLYPRKRLFDEIVRVFRRSGRAVPLFNDKHLSYRWDWSLEMAETAKRLKIPFMAGSSVPLAERRPALELPPEASIEEAVSIHGGGFESYDFHALEVLQSLVEARRGGETGVASVEYLDRQALLATGRDGKWTLSLAEAAMAAELGPGTPPLVELLERPPFAGDACWGIAVRYRDGLRATVLRVGQSGTRWSFACRLRGSPGPVACRFYVGPWNNRCLFKALCHAIQHHFRTGRPPYPLERTLLVSGVLDAAASSRQEGRAVETPHLGVAYPTVDFRPFRETGASWKLLTEGTPEPEGIHRMYG